MQKPTKRNISLFTYMVYLFCSLFSIAGSIVSVIRFQQFESFYYDFGIFDTAIWNVAHFSPPIIDHFLLSSKWIFADHFNPSIFLLSPLYWFTTRAEIILIAQAIIVGLSGIVLYKIGQNVVKNDFTAFAIVVSYLLFLGVQNAVITDFHEVTIAVLPFMLSVLGIVKKNIWLYGISFIILLGFKESNFLIGIGLAISMFFLQKKWRKLAIATILFSILWGFLTIVIIIPFFSGGKYLYLESHTISPVSIVASFFNTAIKRQTLFVSYGSFGFLPILSPFFWFLQFQDLFIRMFSSIDERWGLGFHYSILTGAIFAVSSIFSIQFLSRIIKWSFLPVLIGILLIGNASFLYRFVLHGPFALSYNKAFYAHTKDFAFLDQMIAKVPSNATVTAQNNLASHFTHQKTWILRSNHAKGIYDSFEKQKPQYILMDNRSGQNPNDMYGIDDVPFMLDSLMHDTHYMLFYHEGDQYIFKRKT